MRKDQIEEIFVLMNSSPYHKDWTEEQYEDLLWPPLSLQQFITGVNDDESLFFFATWAFPEEHHIQEYFRTKRFPKEGFYANGEDIWIIDFICLGGVADVSVAFRCLKNLLCSMGHRQCFWLRTEKSKLGFHAVKE